MKRLAIVLALIVVMGALTGCFLLKPSAPFLKLEGVTENSVRLSWKENTEVDGFKIYRRQGNGRFVLLANLNGNVSTYTDSGLLENTFYSYKMISYKFGVSSDWSNVLEVKTAYDVAGKVLNVEGGPLAGAEIFVNGIQKAVSDELGRWEIFNLTGSATLSVKKENWVFQPEHLTVFGPRTDVLFVGTRLPGIPYSPNPSNLSTNVATSVRLSWSCVGSLLKYDLYFGTSRNGMRLVATAINTASYSISNLHYATKYYWEVTAWNSIGKAVGPVWEFTTISTPISLSGHVTDTSGAPLPNVRINFSNGYTSVYTDTNGYWHKNGIRAPVTVTPYKYRWQFTPSSTVVSSSNDNVNFIGSYVDHAPLPPSDPFPSDGAINVATNVTLTWNDSDPDGDTLTYTLYFGTSVTPPLKVSHLTTKFYTFNNLEPSTTYYWKVAASDGIKTATGSTWYFQTVQTTPNGTATVTGTVDVYTGKSAFVSSARIDKKDLYTVPLKEFSEKNYIPHEVVLCFRAKHLGVRNIGRIPFSYEVLSTLKTKDGMVNAALIKVSTSVASALNYFKKMSYIKSAQPNYVVHALDVPNDTYYTYQWNLPDVEMPEAWQVTKGNNTVIVAVLDTGVSSTHPDLQNVLVPGYNFVSDSTNTEDDYGHGTHVAGIIDADTNNAMGVAGVDWGEPDSVKIMPIKVLDSTGSGSAYSVAQGIVYAVNHGAKVINMSLGESDYDALEEEACTFAYDNGVVLVAAAGNEDQSTLDYPAAFSTVIPVSAVGPDNERASYSNYSSDVLWAPGGDYTNSSQDMILSTYYATSTQTNTYAYMEGTSMAAPHVSAIVALMISRGITGPANIWNILKDTASSVLASQDYGGYGLVNAYSAVTYNGGWEPMIVWAENVSNGNVYPTYINPNGSFSLTLPSGTYKIYAWQDFNSDNVIDVGDFYGYFGYDGGSTNTPLSVDLSNGESIGLHIYVSPEIDNTYNPFASMKKMEKILKFKEEIVKTHYSKER